MTERRRNMRPENCRACGKHCEAGEGYLYRDTNSRTSRQNRNRRTGAFGWFVKCADCHAGEKTRLTVRMEKDAAARADEPIVRPWSVSQVKGWTVTRTTHEGDVAIRVEGKGISQVVSYRDRINSAFDAPSAYHLEEFGLAGKPLSRAAAELIGEQIKVITHAINAEERASAEAAVAKLVAAGATCEMWNVYHCYKVEYKGGQYTLWGCVEGKNKVTGIITTTIPYTWIETTAEKLLEENAHVEC